MERTKKVKKVSAILCSDMHLREDQPVCRTDDFMEAQSKKLVFLHNLQKQHACPVLHAGDLFHHWKPSPRLLSFALQLLPNKFHTVYGQHDLPQHNYELRYKSGIFTLESANKVSTLHTVSGDIKIVLCNWNESPMKLRPSETMARILVWHTMVYHRENIYHTDAASSALQLLKKYPEYDLILTGDNHIPFIVKHEGRALVNPGSFTRQRASETHQPRVYLYYAEDNTVEECFLPSSPYVITREHIDKKTETNQRLEAFISRLDADFDVSLSFKDNIREFLNTNPVRESVVNLIYEILDKS